ncbi:ThuA domain-containing protein [Metabacillus sp. Hm71]|uniref:ThuA domain-containing protein n=1 Tax=Metabacillus sp. Hm71 TaxID=3450743 RepID=UPI003F41F196
MKHASLKYDVRTNKGLKKALIVYGGAPEHHPKEIADILSGLLREEFFFVQISTTLDSFIMAETQKDVDLIVLIWTRGEISQKQLNALLSLVHSGAGFVGIHASVGAFRSEINYHSLIGGQFLSHPGGVNTTYKVFILDKCHPITRGIQDFTVTTEKYYMLIDPAIHVVAATCFRNVMMPVVWTKYYGKGRVFYNSLGHTLDIVCMPQVLRIMRNGMIWAARKR